MMDLKEIIKWFIPCFHILLVILKSKDLRLTFVCLFLLFNFRVGCAANVNSVRNVQYNAKNVGLVYDKLNVNQSDVLDLGAERDAELPQFRDGSVGRTFGRPFKKMMGAMLPLIFQIGAASTWAVVAALVGVKTLFVSLVILKILLIAGAAKTLAFIMTRENDILRRPDPEATWYQIRKYKPVGNNTNMADANGITTEWVQINKVGAIYGAKHQGQHQGWESPHNPQKEIHVHIHNGNHEIHEEPAHVPVYGSWSREDALDQKSNHIDPYTIPGPQTIKTPFGNYIRVDSNEHPLSSNKRK